MTTIFVVCGRVNYTNLSRYSELSEKTYRRHFESGLALEGLNQALIEKCRTPCGTQVLAVDCTFVEKSGHHTHGLDWFYNGKTQKAEKGLEWSVVALVDLEQNTAYTLSAQQTEPGLSKTAQPAPEKAAPQKTRVNFYLGHLASIQSYVPSGVRYVVADAFYSKFKWVQGLVQLDFDAIGKLRCDANLNCLYHGPQKPRGRHRRYDGKLDLTETRRLDWVAQLDKGLQLYTAVVWSVSFKRMIRIAYLLREHNGKRSYVVLFSTDVEIDPLLLYRCYKARFQIEFIFRDARQFTGLTHCQARSPRALDSHINASLTAVNLAKAVLQQQQPKTAPLHFSLASYKRLILNQHLLLRFISMFELDHTFIKSLPAYQDILDYGSLET